MSLTRDLKLLYHLALAPIRGTSHQERLESFYAAQADAYDESRRAMLHGRDALYQALPTPVDGVWIEMGGGTAANLEFLGDRLASLRQVHVVDLSTSLLDIARRRIRDRSWSNVALHAADATTVAFDELADVITFSYSITMIPDWYLALENARRLLKPGGILGVVDFYVARKHPPAGFCRHGWWTRTFWPTYFAADNVNLNADHVPYLHQHFEPIRFEERRKRIGYVPLARVPYYWFVGRHAG